MDAGSEAERIGSDREPQRRTCQNSFLESGEVTGASGVGPQVANHRGHRRHLGGRPSNGGVEIALGPRAPQEIAGRLCSGSWFAPRPSLCSVVRPVAAGEADFRFVTVIGTDLTRAAQAWSRSPHAIGSIDYNVITSQPA